MHDIGKLSVPDPILQKPGPLTDEEFEIIKRHPEWGDKMLVDLGFGEEIRHLVRTTTSGSTAPATRTGPEGSLISVRRPDPRPSATSTTHSSRAASTEMPGRTSGRSELLREQSGTSFDAKCVAALERVLASELAPLAAAV